MPLRIPRPLVILLFACTIPASARADDFADFRVPANKYLQWTGSASASSYWDHATAGPDHHARGSTSGLLRSILSSWRETDTRSMSLLAAVTTQGSRFHSLDHSFDIISGSPLLNDLSQERSERRVSEALELKTGQRWYPGSGVWNLSVDLGGLLNDSQSWSNTQYIWQLPQNFVDYSRQEQSSSAREYRSLATGGLGVGLGRVRNATGVYEARVLEDRLRASGALTRALSPEARQRLAGLMYARGDFDASMDRPASPVWDAVERILQEDGALSSPALSAADLFRLVEPFIPNASASPTGRDGLPNSPMFRAIGWNVGVSVTGQTERSSNRYDFATTFVERNLGVPQPPFESRGGSQGHSIFDAVWAGGSAEYHRPLSLRLQWDASSHAAIPLRHEDRGLEFSTQTGLGWIVADRWMASLSAQQARSIRKNDDSFTSTDFWATAVSASAYYFVTDHVTLTIQASQNWQKFRSDYYAYSTVDPGAGLRSNGGSIGAGLTYRFAGFTRVAGLFPAGGSMD